MQDLPYKRLAVLCRPIAPSTPLRLYGEPEVLGAFHHAQQVLKRVEVERRRLPARPHVADGVASLRRSKARGKTCGHGLRRLGGWVGWGGRDGYG